MYVPGGKTRIFAPQALGFNRPPGGVVTLATDLVPGRYAFYCYTKDPDGVSHVEKGMFSEFRVNPTSTSTVARETK